MGKLRQTALILGEGPTEFSISNPYAMYSNA